MKLATGSVLSVVIMHEMGMKHGMHINTSSVDHRLCNLSIVAGVPECPKSSYAHQRPPQLLKKFLAA